VHALLGVPEGLFGCREMLICKILSKKKMLPFFRLTVAGHGWKFHIAWNHPDEDVASHSSF
jgi:hypothetical protein